MKRNIVTSYVHPPIPYRGCDWCAYFVEDGEEAGRYGWGETHNAAIKDLKQRYGKEE